MTPERRIRALHLSAPEERWIGRGAFLVEDALRTASLPWADGGRLLLVRAVDLGTIPAGAAPSSVALALERRLRDVTVSAVHATDSAAPRAAAVWFRDAAEAHALLAVRLARGEEPAAWFWPLAVSAWKPGTPRTAALRSVLLSVLETPAGPAAVIEVVRAVWQAGGIDELAAALAPDDGPWLLRACGWRMPDAEDAPPIVRGAGALVLARWAGEWGIGDARTAWLAAVLKKTVGPAFGRGPHPPAPSPIAPPSPGRGGEPSPPAPLPRAGEGRKAGIANEAEDKEGSFPLSRRQGGRWERGSGGEAPNAAATKAAAPSHRPSPAPPPNERQGANVPTPPPLPPQCRDAPWGVSEAAPSSQKPRSVDGHPMPSDSREAPDPDRAVDTLPDRPFGASRPIGRLSDPSVVAAAETPRGASLHWGGDDRGMEESAPLGEVVQELESPAGASSSYAGLFFLLPVLTHVGLSAFLEEHPQLQDAGFPARFLDHMAKRLGALEDDPIRRALLVEEKAIEGEEALFTTWRIAVRRWCRRRAGIGLFDLICRPGLVIATRTHVDVFFDPGRVEIRVRRVGLDLDPGWVPWLGRVVLFHYEQPPEVLHVG